MPIPKWGWTQPRPNPSWVWTRPRLPPSVVWTRPRQTTCVNIIICVINIIFSLIIQSVQIKNSIIYVINIIIFIIT